MRIILLILVLGLALAPVARSQTYVPGQTAAASQGLLQQQLQTQQQDILQLQRQQNALAMQPGDPGLQAQIQANQVQLRQLQQDNLAAQMQLQQQQRAQLRQSMAGSAAVA